MNYTDFIYLRPEISLIAVIVILMVCDLFGTEKSRRNFNVIACILFFIHIVVNCLPMGTYHAFGGMYICSPIGTIVKTILNVGTLLVMMQAGKWLDSEQVAIRRGEFYIILFSTLFGMYLMLSAGNFLLFFIGMETASIPMAALAAYDKYRRESMEAGAKYILMTAFASGLSLYGVSLIYGTTGTLYFEDVIPRITGAPIQLMAMAFFFVGLFFKVSLVPFHLWTADVYQGAPTPVTAYLSVISKGAGCFTLMMVCIKVFAPIFEIAQMEFYAIIIASITIANLFAIRQTNIKRFFAFSSISQAGYLMLGVISGTALGMGTLVFYILIYMVSNIAAFGVISTVEQNTQRTTIAGYNGLYASNPRLAVVMMLALFSLAGIPPFAGFFSKFFIFSAAAEQGFYVLVFIALLNTIVSLYYYLLVVKAMFINKSEEEIERFKSDRMTRISLTVCTIGIIVLGLASPLFDTILKYSYGI